MLERRVHSNIGAYPDWRQWVRMPRSRAILVHARPTIARAPLRARRRPRRAGRSRRRSPGAPGHAVRRRVADHAVTVTFDRPVAGSLDRTVDPRAVFAIAPGGRRSGRLARSRDPPFPPRRAARAEHQLYRDRGERLRRDGREPAARAVRVHASGCAAPACSPARRSAPTAARRYLPPDARFDLVRRRAGRPGRRSSAAVYVEFDRLCSAARRRPARRSKASGASPPTTGGTSARPAAGIATASADPLRRVVRLAPRAAAAARLRRRAGGARRLRRAGRGRAAALGARDLRRLPPRRGRECGWSGRRLPHRAARRYASARRCAAPRCGATSRSGPAVPFELGDTSDVRAEWVLDATAARRVPPTPSWPIAALARRVRPGAHRQSRRRPPPPPATRPPSTTPPAAPSWSGRARARSRSRFVNVDTLEVVTAPVPDSLEAAFLARSEWSWNELWPALLPAARRERIAGAERARPRPRLRRQARGTGVPAARHADPARRAGHQPRARQPEPPPAADRAAPGDRPRRARAGREARRASSGSRARATGGPRAGAAVALHDAKGRVARPVGDRHERDRPAHRLRPDSAGSDGRWGRARTRAPASRAT